MLCTGDIKLADKRHKPVVCNPPEWTEEAIKIFLKEFSKNDVSLENFFPKSTTQVKCNAGPSIQAKKSDCRKSNLLPKREELSIHADKYDQNCNCKLKDVREVSPGNGGQNNYCTSNQNEEHKHICRDFKERSSPAGCGGELNRSCKERNMGLRDCGGCPIMKDTQPQQHTCTCTCNQVKDQKLNNCDLRDRVPKTECGEESHISSNHCEDCHKQPLRNTCEFSPIKESHEVGNQTACPIFKEKCCGAISKEPSCVLKKPETCKCNCNALKETPLIGKEFPTKCDQNKGLKLKPMDFHHCPMNECMHATQNVEDCGKPVDQVIYQAKMCPLIAEKQRCLSAPNNKTPPCKANENEEQKWVLRDIGEYSIKNKVTEESIQCLHRKSPQKLPEPCVCEQATETIESIESVCDESETCDEGNFTWGLTSFVDWMTEADAPDCDCESHK